MQPVITTDGFLYFDEQYIEPQLSHKIHLSLLDEISWNQEQYTLFGKTVLAPRLVCWYGDEGKVYAYSGVTHEPKPWLPLLLELKNRIESETGYNFNSVLANLYRNGRDSMGWHADQECELGINPVIASLSFGASRRFKIRHNKSKQIINFDLTSGSLLIMTGKFQHCWQHSVPKTSQIKTSRINLTYRYVE